jgi:hypothetical protein
LFIAHDVRFVALIDAHEKADTSHRDVSLGNLILSRLGEGTERVGHLIDWELSCKLSRPTARDHVLTVHPILLALNRNPDAFEGDSRFYICPLMC